jgi:hypothetical protein
VGQYTSNPLIRNIIGQPKSSFDLRDMMDRRKIIIVNLAKGLVGEANTSLLGSMLTTRLYLAAMSRADVTNAELARLPNFYFYIDEFQSIANASFADILSEARKYKLNLTLAHQYIEQMPEELQAAVFGNVGTSISFRVGPMDAELMEKQFAPKFMAQDFINLGFAQIYLSLMIDGVGSPPFSARTLPPIQPIPAGAAGSSFFGRSVMTASVVRNIPAIDAAFCSAVRVTLAGSMIPALIISSNTPVAALYPTAPSRFFYFFCDHRTIHSSVVSNLAKWFFECTAQNIHSYCLFGFEFEPIECANSPNKRNSTTWHHPFFNRRFGSTNCIFNTMFHFFHFGFGSSTNTDDGDAAGKFS